MDSEKISKDRFFPRRFEFFNYGSVEVSNRSCDPKDIDLAPFIVIFQLTGDERGLCAVAFEEIPATADGESMAIEIANILVSKFATQLAEATSGIIDISPPELLQHTERRRRLLATTLQHAKYYEYVHGQTRLGLRLAYLAVQGGNT